MARRLEHIQSSFWVRVLRRLYGSLRLPLNFGATVVMNMAGEALSRALGNLTSDVTEAQVREFFPDLPFRSDATFNSLGASFGLLERLAQLVKRLGFGRTIIVLDKLDEDSRLEGDAEKIAYFVRGVITQTNLHLSNNIQLIASIWSVPFNMLLKNDNVRTQKMNVEFYRGQI